MFSSLFRATPRIAAKSNFAFAEALEPRRLLAAHLPTGFTDTQVATGLFSPTAMDIAPDGRIFVVEQTGDVRVIKNGALLTQPFASVNVTSTGEHGLLGITFDPNFETNHFVYVYYTTPGTPFHNRLSRFTANGDVAAGSETVLLDLDNLDPEQLFHDGGGLHFGPDGMLYVSTGENEHPENSQSLSNLQGKILRINPNGSIPTDNPFYNTATGKNRLIWAYGLRNPYTYAFRPGTGTMFINDVGQDLFEEINQGIAGANYGWPQQEGESGTGQSGITDPIFSYDHTVGNAITGGAFYPSNSTFPTQYNNKYFFADIGGGWIHVLNPTTRSQTNFATNVAAPVDLDVGSDGSLYYLGRTSDGDFQNNSGFVSVIRFSAGQAPSIVEQPSDQTVGKGQSATFTASAAGQAPLVYQWQKDGANIAGATSPTLTLNSVQLGDDGARYRVRVTNGAGSVTSDTAMLTVLNDAAPSPIIRTPSAGTKFFAGQTISYNGTGVDPEDGNLNGSHFTWQVDYHTGSIVRPFVQPTTGAREGTFRIPTITPYTKSNVFYRIMLTVTDDNGLSKTVTRDITPLTANVTVKTSVPGLKIKLDGQDSDAMTFNGVQGIARDIGVDTVQSVNGRTYVFDGWSDGGDETHQISTPGRTFSYIANFIPQTTKGLQGTFFNNKNFTGTQVTRIDKTVSFNIGAGKPDAAISRDTWAAKWVGKFQTGAADQKYTFSIPTDGGVRLRVNGQIVINSLTPQNQLHTVTGQLELAAGQKYPLILEYIHDIGAAQIDLRYSTPVSAEQTIPFSALYAPTTEVTTFNPTADAYVQGGSSSNQNFGDENFLLVKNHPSDDFERDAYLRFDLTGTNVITRAKLRIFGALSGADNANITLGVYSAGKASFSDESINFANRPAVGTLQASAIVSTDTEDQWYEFDLTNFVKAATATGLRQFTLVLRNLQPSVTSSIFNANEAGSNAPELNITS